MAEERYSSDTNQLVSTAAVLFDSEQASNLPNVDISIRNTIARENFKIHYDELLRQSKPISFPLFDLPFQKNAQFTGREDQLRQIADYLSQQNTVAITTQAIAGLGGVGKTQLSIEYAYRSKANYQIIWFLNGQNIDADYLRFAAQLKVYGESPKEIIERTKLKLQELGNYLLIIDDAENYEAIKSYLPQTGKNGHVLITTRHRLDWQKMLELGVFALDEGLIFFKKLTDFKGEEKQDVIYLIEKLLGLLPLALTQAGAFIKQTGISVKEYIQFFETKLQELWRVEDKARDYSQTIAVTWEITINWVKQKYPEAEDLLCGMSCLASTPNMIDQSWLTGLVANEQLRIAALSQLADYSMIERHQEPNNYLVHALVQDVIFNNSSEERKILAMTQCLQSLEKIVNKMEYTGVLIAHLDKLLSYSEKYILPKELIRMAIIRSLKYKTKLDIIDAAQEKMKQLKVNFIEKINYSFPEDVKFYMLYLICSVDLYVSQRASKENFLEIENKINSFLQNELCQFEGNLLLISELKHAQALATFEQHENFFKSEQQFLQVLRQAQAANHEVIVLSCYCNLGSLNEGQKKFNEAVRYYDKALEIHENSGYKYPNMGFVYNGLGAIYRRGRDFDRNKISQIEQLSKNWQQAEDYYNKSIQESDRFPNDAKASRYKGWAYYGLAIIFYKRNQGEMAKEYYLKFKEEISKIFTEWPGKYKAPLERLEKKLVSINAAVELPQTLQLSEQLKTILAISSASPITTTFFQQPSADEWQRQIQENQAELGKKNEVTEAQTSDVEDWTGYSDEEVEEGTVEDESPIPSDEENSDLATTLKPSM